MHSMLFQKPRLLERYSNLNNHNLLKPQTTKLIKPSLVTLQNKGENNCYVNVIIHTLFHCKTWMKHLLNDDSFFPSLKDHHSVLEILLDLMHRYHLAVNNSIANLELNPFNFRVSWASYFKSKNLEMFQLSETGDPIELLQFIWTSLHSSLLFERSNLENSEKICSPQCVIHQWFRINIKEKYTCMKCKYNNEIKYDSNYFQYEIYMKDWLRAIKYYNYGYNYFHKNFFSLLRTSSYQCDQKCEKCKIVWDKRIIWGSIGKYFLVNLTWNDTNPKLKNILDVYCLISSVFAPKKDFVCEDDFRNSCEYFLFGLIGFRTGHYVCAFYSGDYSAFILYDDSHWNIFKTWLSLVRFWIDNHVHPVWLCYQKAESVLEKIDFDFTIQELYYKDLSMRAKEIDEWMKYQDIAMFGDKVLSGNGEDVAGKELKDGKNKEDRDKKKNNNNNHHYEFEKNKRDEKCNDIAKGRVEERSVGKRVENERGKVEGKDNDKVKDSNTNEDNVKYKVDDIGENGKYEKGGRQGAEEDEKEKYKGKTQDVSKQINNKNDDVKDDNNINPDNNFKDQETKPWSQGNNINQNDQLSINNHNNNVTNLDTTFEQKEKQKQTNITTSPRTTSPEIHKINPNNNKPSPQQTPTNTIHRFPPGTQTNTSITTDPPSNQDEKRWENDLETRFSNVNLCYEWQCSMCKTINVLNLTPKCVACTYINEDSVSKISPKNHELTQSVRDLEKDADIKLKEIQAQNEREEMENLKRENNVELQKYFLNQIEKQKTAQERQRLHNNSKGAEEDWFTRKRYLTTNKMSTDTLYGNTSTNTNNTKEVFSSEFYHYDKERKKMEQDVEKYFFNQSQDKSLKQKEKSLLNLVYDNPDVNSFTHLNMGYVPDSICTQSRSKFNTSWMKDMNGNRDNVTSNPKSNLINETRESNTFWRSTKCNTINCSNGTRGKCSSVNCNNCAKYNPNPTNWIQVLQKGIKTNNNSIKHNSAICKNCKAGFSRINGEEYCYRCIPHKMKEINSNTNSNTNNSNRNSSNNYNYNYNYGNINNRGITQKETIGKNTENTQSLPKNRF